MIRTKENPAEVTASHRANSKNCLKVTSEIVSQFPHLLKQIALAFLKRLEAILTAATLATMEARAALGGDPYE